MKEIHNIFQNNSKTFFEQKKNETKKKKMNKTKLRLKSRRKIHYWNFYSEFFSFFNM